MNDDLTQLNNLSFTADVQPLRPSPKPEPKRRGKTAEAKVSASLDTYLKTIGAITIRTNAGTFTSDSGNVVMGAKAGTSDKTCCLPGGQFLGLEVKSEKGKLSEAQARYGERVRRLGGLYIVARSVAELRAALVAHFGADVVARWEH